MLSLLLHTSRHRELTTFPGNPFYLRRVLIFQKDLPAASKSTTLLPELCSFFFREPASEVAEDSDSGSEPSFHSSVVIQHGSDRLHIPAPQLWARSSYPRPSRALITATAMCRAPRFNISFKNPSPTSDLQNRDLWGWFQGADPTLSTKSASVPRDNGE